MPETTLSIPTVNVIYCRNIPACYDSLQSFHQTDEGVNAAQDRFVELAMEKAGLDKDAAHEALDDGFVEAGFGYVAIVWSS